ncbi:hypothetical protein VNI00_015411 [Paramarasmius palmivorus]|uniref:NAD-dependent epimerase/dehydratase domain-containing protein n=1 Tax=Paramarasmius palmivorus TaxID=297713 RepID=A0AAW0BK35_9AGAR
MASARMFRVFMLGSTGFLGSQLLVELSRSEIYAKTFHINALLRSVSQERESTLKGVYSDLEIVEGSLDDEDIIEEQASQADIVINCASSDNVHAVRATLSGLRTRSARQPENPPLYIHVSGLGIISDNCRGEAVDAIEYSDTDLDLMSLPPNNQHLLCDVPIVQAGSRQENPIRTAIIFPGWIYGAGEGVQKVTAPIRILLTLAQSAGYLGTWGNGHNRISTIHVKDAANAIITLMDAAFSGKALQVGNGAEELYFSVSQGEAVRLSELTAEMGNILYRKGVVTLPGSRPYPDEVLAPSGHAGWSLFGGNLLARPERLLRLGWQPTETAKTSLMGSLPVELEYAMQAKK